MDFVAGCEGVSDGGAYAGGSPHSLETAIKLL